MAIFPYFMYWKCPYVGGWVVQKRLKTPLRNIKMAPNQIEFQTHLIKCYFKENTNVCILFCNSKLTELDAKMQLLALNLLQKNKLALTLSKDKQQL